MANRGSDRERSRSRNARAATGEANNNATRRVRRDMDVRNALPEQIRCRDPACSNDTFRVFVADPNRSEASELECVRCATFTAIDLARRVMYQR